MPQINASLPSDLIKTVTDLQGKESFSSTIKRLVELGATIEKNPIGKLVAMYGWDVINGLENSLGVLRGEPLEFKHAQELYENATNEEVVEWREKVKNIKL